MQCDLLSRFSSIAATLFEIQAIRAARAARRARAARAPWAARTVRAARAASLLRTSIQTLPKTGIHLGRFILRPGAHQVFVAQPGRPGRHRWFGGSERKGPGRQATFADV